MKAYLSGPMTGITDFNYPEFHRCATELREKGFEVVSPAEIAEGENWDACLKEDLKQMLDCDIIINIKGWGHSRGARLEHMVGVSVGLPFCDFNTAIKAGPEKLEELIINHSHYVTA